MSLKETTNAIDVPAREWKPILMYRDRDGNCYWYFRHRDDNGGLCVDTEIATDICVTMTITDMSVFDDDQYWNPSMGMTTDIDVQGWQIVSISADGGL